MFAFIARNGFKEQWREKGWQSSVRGIYNKINERFCVSKLNIRNFYLIK